MTRRSNRHDRHDAPLQRRAAARARSKCGGSAWPGGRALRLQRRAAPTHTAHAAVARKRSPAHLRMMMSETPLKTHPPPSPSAGARSARCTERLEQRKAHDVFDIPTIPRRQRAQPGEHMWRCGRSGVQRQALRLWCRARSARPRPGCRIGAQAPGAARHLGAERVARGGDGSQRLCRLAHRRAAPSARRSALGA